MTTERIILFLVLIYLINRVSGWWDARKERNERRQRQQGTPVPAKHHQDSLA